MSKSGASWMNTTANYSNKTYIRSNAGTVMHFLWFLCGLLLVLVTGLCTFVIFGRDDIDTYHLDAEGQFYYEIKDQQATIVKFVDANEDSFTIPSSVNYGNHTYPVTTIGNNAFRNHFKLTSVEIPDSVTEIRGNYTDAHEQTGGAFSGCLQLQTVKLGKNIGRIGAYAFKNCSALSSIDFPDSIQYVDNGAFQGCIGLTSVALHSNCVLGANCFKDCIGVKTLILSDDVRLEHNKSEVLAALSNVTTFEVGENSVYHLVDGCLMTTEHAENDTLLLGARGAVVPTLTTKIADWAWGDRASNTIFHIPSTVTWIGAHSFCNDHVAIRTNASAKPFDWETSVPVGTEAKLVTCRATAKDGTHPEALFYVYKKDTVLIEPKAQDYARMFAEVESNTPFLEWERDGDNYVARYESDTLATDGNLDALQDALDIAGINLGNAETRLKFKLDFWEDYKNLYYQSLKFDGTSYQYAVLAATAKLNTMNQNVANEKAEILESTDWKIGLQNLVDAVNALLFVDLSKAVTSEQYADLLETLDAAETTLKNSEHYNEVLGKNTWAELRKQFELLTVDVTADGLLGKEIAFCYENLADQRAKYTFDTWQILQKQLQIAEQATRHSLNLTTIRKDLIAARENLCEVDLSEHKTRLSTMLSACRGFVGDYVSGEIGDRLQIKVSKIYQDINTLDTDTKVDAELGDLESMYRELKPVDHSSEYQNSTGIFDRKSIPFFVTAVMLFTGAVAAGAKAAALQKQLRQTQE